MSLALHFSQKYYKLQYLGHSDILLQNLPYGTNYMI
jgi:hypothetical protein